jgi:hypothetical protein
LGHRTARPADLSIREPINFHEPHHRVSALTNSDQRFALTGGYHLARCVTGSRAIWDFATGYSHTLARWANGITSVALYHQFRLCGYHSISMHTGICALQAFRCARGVHRFKKSGTIAKGTVGLGPAARKGEKP